MVDMPQTTDSPTGLGKAFDRLLYDLPGLILWVDYGHPRCRPNVFEDGCEWTNLARSDLLAGSDGDRGIYLREAVAGVVGEDIAWEETAKGYPHGAIGTGSAANCWGELRMGSELRRYFIDNPTNRFLFFFVGEVTGAGASGGNPQNPVMNIGNNVTPNNNYFARLNNAAATSDGQLTAENRNGDALMHLPEGRTWAMWTDGGNGADSGWNGNVPTATAAIANTLMIGAPAGCPDNASNGVSRIARMMAIWDLTAGGAQVDGYSDAIELAAGMVAQEYGPGGAWRHDVFTPPELMLG